MSNYEQIAKQAEQDLNTYQAKTGNARRQDADNAGVNPLVENQFEGAKVEFGDELSTNRGYNKRIPPNKLVESSMKVKEVLSTSSTSHTGSKAAKNDNDVVGNHMPQTSGSARDIESQGQEATRANVGRNPPGPGGSQFKGEDYYQPESVPDSISAEGWVAPDTVTQASKESERP
ncbi:hypothetical protein CEP52_007692 [Fusarium oligoseptatum]|uniref:Uncharacterized protein n=1 Tax=Fusarium oligoseptatum TaxID=2604345 RepID=A0A428TLJ6_9HYPO|nr:hypothetical protein CEP52_007692 [Fusarium oligoseptatum]